MFPEFIYIDGYTWEVVYSTKRPRWAISGSCATTHFDGRKIWVKYTGNIEVDLRNLAHELGHTFVHGAELIPSKEEFLVEMMEEHIYSFLRDNDTSCFHQRRFLEEKVPCES